MKGEAEMPRRATRVPLDDLDSLNRDVPRTNFTTEQGRPLTAEEVLDTMSTPSLEGIARILGVMGENAWGNGVGAQIRREIQERAQSAGRVRRVTRADRIREQAERNSEAAREMGSERRPLIMIQPTVTQRVSYNPHVSVNEETHELVPADEPLYPITTEQVEERQKQIRKMRGKIVICQKAMNGQCPVLIARAETTDTKELDVWCPHMVPHAHRGGECSGDSYDREDAIPAKYRRRHTCRAGECNPMEPVPEHRRWVKKERVSKGDLPNHRRTLIIE
jgi:hypothetical protein